ncbi:hypothetical protein Arub01_48310 [Actinomadura rubrobrunea]|uniref:Integrase catalytic domain-containing protein n=1 Tax=Actinomadura rubrobrunea TaxID=115335 RepID=A0A9W6UYT5_9ACTN|nr:hypothetical protein Arub01_48310 [Actinomadura rubrobrunea]
MFLVRATAWFAARGVTVRRVLTDNAWAYTKTTWRTTCATLGISPRWTRPWRPQANGKVERFHRTRLEEWAYQWPYACEAERQAAFGDWLDWYNHHRHQTGIAGQTPADRVTNLPEQHTWGVSGGSCVDPEQGGDQHDRRPEIAGEFVEPGGDPASLLEPVDTAFDPRLWRL